MKRLEEMTFNERLVRKAICDFRDDIVGQYENQYLDNPSEFEIEVTKEEICDYIYNELMNGKSKVIHTHKGLCIERKHVRFLGSQFIKELIDDRVKYDYYRNGWAFPHTF